MHRNVWTAAALGLLGWGLPSLAHGQLRPAFFIGGGATVSTGEFGDYANTGWQALGGVELPLGNGPLSARVDAFYGRSSHQGDLGEGTKLPGATASLLYRFGTSSIRPYLIGGAGFISHKYDPGSSGFSAESESMFALAFGAGLGFGRGNVRFFVESRMIRGSEETSYVPIVGGVTIGAH
jgi:hypothetical protein